MMFFRVTLASWASRVHALLVQLQGPEGPGGRPIPGDGVEAWQPMGLRTRPVIRASTEAAVLELANGERIALLADKGRADGDGVVEPEAGETQLHGLADVSAVIRIRASGDVEITAGAGRNLIVHGGSTPVAKEGSATSGHVHGTSHLFAGPYAVTGPPGDDPDNPTPGATDSATDTIAAGAGSPHVLVP